MLTHLTKDIEVFKESVGTDIVDMPKKKVSTREKILSLLRENPRHSATSLAQEIGITSKGVQRQLAILKRDGIIERIGPDKGGHWQIM